jgi:hypothetical protein
MAVSGRARPRAPAGASRPRRARTRRAWASRRSRRDLRRAAPLALEALLDYWADALAERGLRIRSFRARAGGTIPCGAAPEDDLLVARLPVDLSGVPRLDVALCDERWAERDRLADVPFDRRRSEVVFAERVDRPELRTANVLRFRLLAVDAAGERELATFALAHDPRGPPRES